MVLKWNTILRWSIITTKPKVFFFYQKKKTNRVDIIDELTQIIPVSHLYMHVHIVRPRRTYHHYYTKKIRLHRQSTKMDRSFVKLDFFVVLLEFASKAMAIEVFVKELGKNVVEGCIKSQSSKCSVSIVDVSEPENDDPVRVVDVGAEESPAITVADGPVNDPHLMQ